MVCKSIHLVNIYNIVRHTIPLSENYDSQRSHRVVLVMLKQLNYFPGNKLIIVIIIITTTIFIVL